MKSLMILALAIGSIASATPAAADRVVQRTTVVQHNNSGWHANRAHRRRRVCTTKWRHHQRVRNCYWR